jgi:Xaa-Pro aminopeptidase
VFLDRQERLFEQLSEGAALIIPSGSTTYRNADVSYPFRVLSDYYYLTGLVEPNSFFVLGKKNGQLLRILILYEPSATELQWTCQWTLTLQSPQLEAYDCLNLKDQSTIEQTFIKLDLSFFTVIKVAQNLEKLFPAFKYQYNKNLRIVLDHMRAKKDHVELSYMMKALAHTQSSLKNIQESVLKKNLKNEGEIAALWYSYGYQHNLAQAYSPIIAGGARSCILHYEKHQSSLIDDYALLIDAGYEYHQYASDITRMILLKKPPQLWCDLYSIVHQVQQEVISLLAPGKSFLELQEYTVQRMLIELKKLKIFSQNAKDSDLKRCYMHGIGHFLGLDVHDALSLGKEQAFEPTMAITIEPGLYFNHPIFEDSPYYGIGIRLEDNLLITENSFQNLTTLSSSLDSILTYV